MEALSRALCLLSAAVLLALGAGGQCAAQGATSEQDVKAAFLYKFAGYVEWPDPAFPNAEAPIVIGVLGDDALAAALDQAVAGRAVNGRRMSVRRMKPGEAADGLHILFVGRSEVGRIAQILRGPAPRPVLTVTDSEGALDQGSMINFLVADRRVRFEISVPSAERSQLKLSSRLLAVAAQVRGGTP
jgi:hypothetical protein